MGLAEKRIATAYQNDKFPGWSQKITAVAGYDLPIEIGNWDSFVKEGFLNYYPNTLDFNYFMPLENALKSVCSDDLGRKALQSKIKKVKITCERNWSSLEVTVEGDTLHLDADPSYEKEESCVADYTKRVLSAIEKVL